MEHYIVVPPAKAGVQLKNIFYLIPAFAGMTAQRMSRIIQRFFKELLEMAPLDTAD